MEQKQGRSLFFRIQSQQVCSSPEQKSLHALVGWTQTHLAIASERGEICKHHPSNGRRSHCSRCALFSAVFSWELAQCEVIPKNWRLHQSTLIINPTKERREIGNYPGQFSGAISECRALLFSLPWFGPKAKKEATHYSESSKRTMRIHTRFKKRARDNTQSLASKGHIFDDFGFRSACFPLRQAGKERLTPSLAPFK